MRKKIVLIGAIAILSLSALIAVFATQQNAAKETAWRPYRYARPAVRQYYGPSYAPPGAYGRPYYRRYYRPNYYRSAPGVYVRPGHVSVGPVHVDY